MFSISKKDKGMKRKWFEAGKVAGNGNIWSPACSRANILDGAFLYFL